MTHVWHESDKAGPGRQCPSAEVARIPRLWPHAAWGNEIDDIYIHDCPKEAKKTYAENVNVRIPLRQCGALRSAGQIA
jgi:hypothetical protein